MQKNNDLHLTVLDCIYIFLCFMHANKRQNGEFSSAKKKLGEKIRTLRRGRGLTGLQLAQISGLRYSYLMKIERGNHDIALKDLLRIARSLETTMTRLLGGVA